MRSGRIDTRAGQSLSAIFIALRECTTLGRVYTQYLHTILYVLPILASMTH